MSEEKNIPEDQSEDNNLRVEKSDKHSTGENPSSEQEILQPLEEELQRDTDPQPETPDPKTEIENMEVHHPHHVHHSKKWKDYLFEFLMLFLAVTLGFFVENQREHYIEAQREKQFIRSLINDLMADTTKLNSLINRRTARANSLDSLYLLINSDIPNINTNDIYYFASTAARTLLIRFVSNDGTMQQLKNSGAFRLIRKRYIADSIANYDVSVRNALRQSEVEELMTHDYRQASAKIFDTHVFNQMMDDDINVIKRPQQNPALLNYTLVDLHNWNYKIFSMKGINRANRRDARLLLAQAKNLLTILKKEYGIK